MAENEEELLETRNPGLTAEDDAERRNSAWSRMLKMEVWVPFGLMTFLLLLFYIFNQHHAVKALKRKDQLKTRIKELRAEYISIQSDLMMRSKQSEMAEKVSELGLIELRKPPVKLEKPAAKK
jgi:hypothetical protein